MLTRNLQDTFIAHCVKKTRILRDKLVPFCVNYRPTLQGVLLMRILENQISYEETVKTIQSAISTRSFYLNKRIKNTKK